MCKWMLLVEMVHKGRGTETRAHERLHVNSTLVIVSTGRRALNVPAAPGVNTVFVRGERVVGKVCVKAWAERLLESWGPRRLGV